MSLVNIVPSDSTWESSDDITAANTPAPSKPAPVDVPSMVGDATETADDIPF